MADPIELLKRFYEAAESENAKTADELSAQIAKLEANSEGAVVALNRLGLYTLENAETLDFTAELFKKAASSSIKCDDRYAAQVSYAIVLASQDKRPTGIFQLRKVLSEVPGDSVHAGMALDYLALFLREEEAPEDDIAKIDNQRVATFSKLISETTDADEKEEWQLRLAVAMLERNQHDDHELGLKMLSKINSEIAKDLLKSLKPARKK